MPAAKRTFKSLFGVLLVLAGVALIPAAQNEPVRPKAHGILANDLQASISFEPNQGQTDDRVKFMARGSGYNLFLTPSNALFVLRQAGSSNDLVPTDSNVLTMNLVGANPTPKIAGRDELPGKSSYFLGGDPKKWHTNIPNFGKVQYDDIYPGIDLVFHGIRGQLEYDFVLHPGASPKTIVIEFTGLKDIRLSSRGELVLQTVRGQVCFHKPIAYQEDPTHGRAVQAGYRRIQKQRVGFTIGVYDSTKTLIIDPAPIVGKAQGTNRRPSGHRQISVPLAAISGLNHVDVRRFMGGASQLGESMVHGALKFNSNGSFIYNSTKAFAGQDNFTDQASDAMARATPRSDDRRSVDGFGEGKEPDAMGAFQCFEVKEVSLCLQESWQHH